MTLIVLIISVSITILAAIANIILYYKEKQKKEEEKKKEELEQRNLLAELIPSSIWYLKTPLEDESKPNPFKENKSHIEVVVIDVKDDWVMYLNKYNFKIIKLVYTARVDYFIETFKPAGQFTEIPKLVEGEFSIV